MRISYSKKEENFFEKINVFEKQLTNNGQKIIFTRSPRILLVEDTKIVQKMHMLWLKDLGCQINLAANGTDALMMFKEEYDLIFLDVGLPDIRGSAVAEYIRHLEKELKLKRNVLIGLTAYGEDVREECINAGMDAIYSKPITKEQLKNVLLKWLPSTFNN